MPTRFLLCRDDRFFPPRFLGSHCVALSRPTELADRLEAHRADT